MPILRRGPDANLRATCLRNSDSWQTVEDYLADYNQIPDTSTLSALSQIQVLIRENTQMAYPMADYTYYTWSVAGPHIFPSLLPRKKFTKWFYSLFFRLALPMTLNLVDNMRVIFSPLNLCVLLRLITQLRSFGYSSHWLSEPLLNIIYNTVNTTARPPRTKPMRPVDVKREYRDKKLCTAPFSHELATLARLFQPLLPFKLVSSAIPDSSDIYKHSLRLPGYENIAPQPSCLVVVFMKESLFPDSKAPASMLFNLGFFLNPSTDEMVDEFKIAEVEQLRDEGVRVWSTFHWDGDAKMASLWMSEGLVNEMAEKKWSVGTWRTDIWMPACGPELVGFEGVVSKGVKWA
jgi:hypothetical protein